MNMQFSICIITNAGLRGQSHRREYLLRLLASLPAAGFTLENSEVIVAGALFDGVACTHALPLADLAESGQVSALRNRAIKEAQGDWIVQCDDDVIFAPGYVSAVRNALAEDADIVCTRLLNPNGTRYWDWAAFVPGKGQTLLPYAVHDKHVYATGGHALYRRSIFEKIQWPESIRHGLNEEHALAELARRNGIRYRLCSNAIVFLQYHHCDAEAVIRGQAQANVDNSCSEFKALMASFQSSNSLAIAPNETVLTNEGAQKNIRDRMGYKFAPAPTTRAQPTIDVSILTCCHRYLQRFRVFARSICRQQYDLEKVEVIVANPQSPDGLSTYLSLLKTTTPLPVFEEVLLESTHFRNRGLMIQSAFERARGNVVIGMDCDVVLPPDFLSRIVDTVRQNPNRIVGIYRNFLTPKTTASILTGALDPFANFDSLKSEDQEEVQGYRGVLGYCQATTHDAWKQTGYPAEFDEIAKSDVAFNERLAKIGVTPMFLRDVTVLHLNHERNWMGTDDFL